MHFKYEVVESLKPSVCCHDISDFEATSYETWWRIRDLNAQDYLPGGFDTYAEAERCCKDLNENRV